MYVYAYDNEDVDYEGEEKQRKGYLLIADCDFWVNFGWLVDSITEFP